MFKSEIAGRARRAGFDRKAPTNLALKLAPALRLTGFRRAKANDRLSFRRTYKVGIKADDAFDFSACQIERGGGDAFRFRRKVSDPARKAVISPPVRPTCGLTLSSMEPRRSVDPPMPGVSKRRAVRVKRRDTLQKAG